MKKIIFILILSNLLSTYLYSKELVDCTSYKKLSKDFLKCKAGNLKKKTISAGKNIVKDTKDYQKKEWSKEKKKLNKLKEKIY